MTVEVIPANVQAVQNLSNQVLVSTANESTNGLCQYIPKQSGQVIGNSDNLLIKNGKGQVFQWDITVPEGSIINTANSYITYKQKFTFNCKCTAVPAADADAAVLQTPNTNPNDAATLYLPPGRYSVLDTVLWCEPAYVKKAGANYNVVGYGEAKALCQFPMNSSVIIESTKVQYGNVSHTDENVFQQRSQIQAHLSEEYQAMYATQFFDQNIDPIMQFLVPATHATNVFQVVVYKTFTIGLNMINQLFDIKNKFYTSAYTKQVVQLTVKLQPYTMAQLFYTEDYCDVSKTGISEMELQCYVKSCSTIPTEMNEKGAFVQMYHKYTMDALTLSGGITSKSTPQLSSGHNSTNDVCLCLNIPDITNKDSTFLKQRYTLYNATQIMKIYNKEYIGNQFVFFSDFNLYRGNQAFRYFTENLTNPMLMRHETLRSMNALQQYDTSVSPSFNTILKQMTKYAMIRVNLEAYSMESLGDADVKYDGYHSVMQKVQILTSFKVYNLDADIAENYNPTTANNPEPCRIDNNLINLYAFQYYDQAVIMNTKTGTMQITEDIK